MKKVLLTFMVSVCCAASYAQEVISTEEMTKSISSMEMGTFTRIVSSFPTTTPTGEDTIMHGAITMNDSVYDKLIVPKGLILNHQYTITLSNSCATLTENMIMESGLLSGNIMGVFQGIDNNYIIVSPNNYGFGGEKIDRQAYLYGDITAKGALDCLRGAQTVLADLGYTYGNILASVGYSQGGHSSMATLKLTETDSNYSDIKFDYVFCGAGPYDIDAIYKQFVAEGSESNYPASIPLILSNITSMEQLMGNEVFSNYSDEDLYNEKIADKITEWYNGNYSINTINNYLFKIYDTEGSVKVADMLTPEFLDSTTTIAKDYRTILRKNSLVDGWLPSEDNNIYIFHYNEDEVVPVECSVNMENYLINSGYKGFLETLYYEPNALERLFGIKTHETCGAPFLNYVSKVLNNAQPTGNINGIEGVKENIKEDNNIYDLFGRKLNEIPQTGIYIKNKKKISVSQ